MTTRSVTTHLTTGETVRLRPIGPWDRAREVDLISRLSDHSRYLRFFTGARTLPDSLIDRLVNVDGYHQIAWGALDLSVPGWPLMGVVRAIRQSQPDTADLAMAVLDTHHGKGLARLLMSAVVEDARAGGIRRLAADTLAENAAARRLFKAMGGHATGRDGHVVSYTFDADTVAGRLAAITPGKAMDDLRQAFANQRMRRSA